MKNCSGVLLLLFAAVGFAGCAASQQEEESLELAVLRLKHPGSLTVAEALARLCDSLEHRRNAARQTVRPALVQTGLRIAPDCSPDEKTRAEQLAEKVFGARARLLAAGGLTEEARPEAPPLRFFLEVEALPGAETLVRADLEENGKTLWREVVPVLD